MFEKDEEVNIAKDIDFELHRVFDTNPVDNWPPTDPYFIIGGEYIGRIPYVWDEKKRPGFLKDKDISAVWYIAKGTIRDQKNTILYELIP